METHQVRYFLAVTRSLSFTKAAQECNVAQPSLTRAIKKLEDELGGPLFHRERANTHLTELGRGMLPHIEQSHLAAQAARELAAAFKRGDIAPLRLGLANSVASQLFSDVLKDVRSSVPNFEVSLQGGLDGEVQVAVLKGNLDVVVLSETGVIPDRMRSWPLFAEGFHLIVPRDHRLASKRDLVLQDLEGEDVIEWANCEGCQRLRQACLAAGVLPRFRHRVDSMEQLQNLVRSGFGVGFATLNPALGEGTVARTIDRLPIERTVSLATVAGRPFSAATDAFVRVARMRDWAADLAQYLR